ncbi:putative secreted protein (Por secretion system target) [Flavobacteriaceae bacterium MAR_2010_72]|nr:putative secreted protein (Por secretion system target) [Flavobacteriaceae bacterium MAR_2010_72]TVZ59728.1 putative secreted protein (Por secretion system target) [Flavobacteriaceae bacterium MAR_2010_105]
MKRNLLTINYLIRLVTLLVVLLMTVSLQAQIIYTDIEPDFTGENLGDSYDLNLNNDQIVDYNLWSSTNEKWTFFIIWNPNGANSVLSISPFYTYAVPLDKNWEIFNLSGYKNGEYYEAHGIISLEECYGIVCYYDYNYDWKDKNDKYLGLRFLINGQTHYGWARLNVSSTSQWTIMDYAYNATPNQPIYSGQRVLDLEASDFKTVRVISAKGHISILNLSDRTNYTLYNIHGQQLLKGHLEPSNYNIDVHHLASGLYVIELIDQGSSAIVKKKIFIPL